MNSQTIPVADGQPLQRRFRAAIRSTCQAKPEPNGETSNIESGDGSRGRSPHQVNSQRPVAVRVEFAHWQAFPALVSSPRCAVVNPDGSWKVRMYHLLDDLPSRSAGSTISQVTIDELSNSGTVFQIVAKVGAEEAAELTELVDFPAFHMDFELALNAAWDMAAEGDVHLTITALEEALRLAKVAQRDMAANEAGVI